MTTRDERNADMPGTNKGGKSISEILKKRPPLQPIHEDRDPSLPPLPKPPVKPEPKPSGKFIVTCWDGDMYILEGYESVQDIHDKIMGLDWVRMPNGSQIKASSIAKIQSFEDYSFQNDQKWRHKRGQFLAGRNQDKWWHNVDGYIRDADVKHITGTIKNLPQLGESTQKRLP